VVAHIDEQALQASLQRLRAAAAASDVMTVMHRAVDSVNEVFGYSGAGIMFVTDSGYLSYVAASDEAGRQLEEAQAAAGEGPCYESYVYAREVASPDLQADDRWPNLPAHLSGGIRAVAGIPIMLSGSPVGTLNTYHDEPTEWDDSDIAALRAYTNLISEAVGTALAAEDHSALASQLQYALDYRIVIERAVGYLMAAHRLDATTAFDVLRKRARDSRRHIADIAAEVLGAVEAPGSAEQTGGGPVMPGAPARESEPS
jgi:GAF domain-containing protein